MCYISNQNEEEMMIPKPNPTLLLLSILILSLSSCDTGKNDSGLSVKMSPPVYYQSKNGDRFVAQYGSLSDGSLHFVKIKMPDGREYTLPQAISGSGSRYTDERELVWWEHQNKVRVDARNADGEWINIYSELSQIEDKEK
jgi:membrane-bound inhibitor of C-type lysozyme